MDGHQSESGWALSGQKLEVGQVKQVFSGASKT